MSAPFGLAGPPGSVSTQAGRGAAGIGSAIWSGVSPGWDSLSQPGRNTGNGKWSGVAPPIVSVSTGPSQQVRRSRGQKFENPSGFGAVRWPVRGVVAT